MHLRDELQTRKLSHFLGHAGFLALSLLQKVLRTHVCSMKEHTFMHKQRLALLLHSLLPGSTVVASIIVPLSFLCPVVGGC